MLTTYYKNTIIKSFFMGEKFTLPAVLYVGFSKNPIEIDGSNVAEPAPSTGYKRAQIGNRGNFWSEPVDGVCINKQYILFPTANATWFDVGDTVDVFLAMSEDGTANNDIIAYNTVATTLLKDIDESLEIMIKKGDLKFGFGA